MTLAGIESVLKMSPRASIVIKPAPKGFTIAAVNGAFLKATAQASEFVNLKTDQQTELKLPVDSLNRVLKSKEAIQLSIQANSLGLSSPAGSDRSPVNAEMFPVFNEQNEVAYIILTINDAVCMHTSAVEDTGTRPADFERLEKAVLELNSRRDYAIQDVLAFYANGIERLCPDILCSILEIRNHRLYNLSSPSLPASYIEALEGREIGEYAGSCGTAAYLKQVVIVSDILHDPRWSEYKHHALDAGLMACWAQPIFDSEGDVLATFAIYYRQKKEPNEEQLKIIERAVALLTVILENRRNAEILKETTLLMVQGQELAHFGNWSWDVKNNIVTWSDSLYTIYGLDRQSFKATFEGYLEMLHPDERERVQGIIQNVLMTKQDVDFEERIVRPGGEIRYLKSWAKLKTDDKGNPEKMIGACLDITESKKIQEELLATETRLRSLAWAQSHLVRGPLTRIMGITELLCNKETDEDSRHQLLYYLGSSANELDKVIKEIVNKSS